MKNKKIHIVCIVYFFVGLLGILHHELWLDEAHHLLIGRDSTSLTNLLRNSRYEGHPALWSFWIYAAMHLFHSVFAYQLINILIGTACILVLWKQSPFSVPVNLCISFGYFLSYEYAWISRSYMLSLLVVLCVLALIRRPDRHFIMMACLLALLANLHVFSAFLAIGFAVVLADEWRQKPFTEKWVALAIFFSGLVWCFSSSIPPPDHFLREYNAESFISLHRFGKLPQAIVKGLIPLQDTRLINCWNSNLITETGAWVSFPVCMLCICFAIVFLVHDRKALLVFFIPLVCMLLFFFATPLMLSYHNCGYVSIYFMVAAWIRCHHGFETKVYQKVVIGFLLVIQLYAASVAYQTDYSRPFSNSVRAAGFIDHIPDSQRSVFIVSNQCAGPALSICSNKRLFYLEPNHYATFCQWNVRPFIQPDSILLEKIGRQLKEKDHVYLILNEELKINELERTNSQRHIIPEFRPHFMRAFLYAIVGSENYFIYQLK